MLQQGDARFQVIVDASSDGIVIVDRKGTVLLVNPAAESLFDRPKAELIGEMFGFPVVAGETIELDILRKDGGLRSAEMRTAEMAWGNQTVTLATLRDTLLPRLISGQLRLPEAQSFVEEVTA